VQLTACGEKRADVTACGWLRAWNETAVAFEETHYCGDRLSELKDNHENPSEGCPSPGRNSSPGTPKYQDVCASGSREFGVDQLSAEWRNKVHCLQTGTLQRRVAHVLLGLIVRAFTFPVHIRTEGRSTVLTAASAVYCEN
jgi:hypothetical protein